MQRRQFVLMLGGATAGLFLPPELRLDLPRRLAIAFGGSCSFCHKGPQDWVRLVGRSGMGVRICSDCLALCLQIMHEAQIRDVVRPQQPADSFATPTRGDLEAWLESDIGRPTSGPRRRTLCCSFCDADQGDVRKLIAGPKVYICDNCTLDGAALLPSLA